MYGQQAERLDQVHRVAGARLADDGERDVTLGAQLGHRLEQVRQSLERDVGRRGREQAAGPALDVVERLEQIGVDADGDEAHAVDLDAHVGVDVVDRVLRHDDDARHLRGDLALHLDERVPATDRPALVPVLGVAHLELAVLGDRVVERDDRGDLLLDLQDPVAEALVVVDEVELPATRAQFAGGARAERERLGERAGDELAVLEQVGAGLDLPESGEAAGEVLVERVEARQLGELHPLVEDRVGLPAEHFDRVAEIAQRLGQVARVDALAADVGLAPVGEVGDLERGIRIESGR